MGSIGEEPNSTKVAWIGGLCIVVAAAVTGWFGLYGHGAKGEQKHIQGFVHTQAGEPISSAHVEIVPEPGSSFDKQTDGSGKFNADLPANANDFRVYVNADGFQSSNVEYTSAQSLVELVLKPSLLSSNPGTPEPRPTPRSAPSQERVRHPLTPSGSAPKFTSATTVNCPGGICQSGGVTNNPTVNNYAPPPGSLVTTEEQLRRAANGSFVTKIHVKIDRSTQFSPILIEFSSPVSIFDVSNEYLAIDRINPIVLNADAAVRVEPRYCPGLPETLPATCIELVVHGPQIMTPEMDLRMTIESVNPVTASSSFQS